MPRSLPPHVVTQRTRHGKVVFYYRRGKGARVRLPDITAPGFAAAYAVAMAGDTPQARQRAGAHTFEWLISAYRLSGDFLSLSPETRRKRDGFYRDAIAKIGGVPFRDISRRDIVASREARAATPGQARGFLDAMRGVFRWALEAGHVAVDPTAGVSNPKQKKGAGFPVWTDAEIERYEAFWPIGTHQRVWLAVLLHTGLRRGDAVRIGRQHVRDGVATIKTEKTGMEVSLPVRPELARVLSASPVGDLTWICGAKGRPLTKQSFGGMFVTACKQAGVFGKSAHGVRKASAVEAAEAGLSVPEMDALFGWSGGGMASRYTKSASRTRLAVAATEKIVNKNSPHPISESPSPKKLTSKKKDL